MTEEIAKQLDIVMAVAGKPPHHRVYAPALLYPTQRQIAPGVFVYPGAVDETTREQHEMLARAQAEQTGCTLQLRPARTAPETYDFASEGKAQDWLAHYWGCNQAATLGGQRPMALLPDLNTAKTLRDTLEAQLGSHPWQVPGVHLATLPGEGWYLWSEETREGGFAQRRCAVYLGWSYA